jgi:hypothetical protein
MNWNRGGVRLQPINTTPSPRVSDHLNLTNGPLTHSTSKSRHTQNAEILTSSLQTVNPPHPCDSAIQHQQKKKPSAHLTFFRTPSNPNPTSAILSLQSSDSCHSPHAPSHATNPTSPIPNPKYILHVNHPKQTPIPHTTQLSPLSALIAHAIQEPFHARCKNFLSLRSCFCPD